MVDSGEFKSEVIRIWVNHVSYMGLDASDYDASVNFYSRLMSGSLDSEFDKFIIPFCEILKNRGYSYFNSYIFGHLDETSLDEILDSYNDRYGFRARIINIIKDILETLKNNQDYLDDIIENSENNLSTISAVYEDIVDEDILVLMDNADKGDPESQYLLSNIYQNGYGVETDIEKSNKYLKMSLESGWPDALVDVAEQMELCTSADEKKICMEYYIEAMRAGRLDLSLHVSELIDEETEGLLPDSELDYVLRVAAQQGSSAEQFRYAEYLNKGRTIAAITSSAKKYYQMAAKNGHPVAMFIMGQYFENRNDPDLKIAADWYGKASDKGNADAMCRLADLAFENVMSEVSIDEAIEYYSKASDLGNAEATFKLARLYYDGKMIDKDAHRAVQLLESIRAVDEPDYDTYLGLAYFDDGQIEKGISHLYKVYDKTDPRVTGRFCLYLMRDGTANEDFDDAFDLYSELSERSDVDEDLMNCIRNRISDRCFSISKDTFRLTYEDAVDSGYDLKFINGATEMAVFAYNGVSEIVDIPSEIDVNGAIYAVTEISDDAFILNPNISLVRTYHSLRIVGANAFYGCDCLIGIILSDTVKSVKEGAFSECTSLNKILFPNNIEIDNGVLQGCTGLKNVGLPEDLESIPDYMFYGCSMLTDVGVPPFVNQIGFESFKGCEKLRDKRIVNTALGIVDFKDYI